MNNPAVPTLGRTAHGGTSAWQSINTRRSVPPAFLNGPGPSRDELLEMLGAASRAPDHGMLVPWRFIIVDAERATSLCDRLCDAFVEAEASSDAGAISKMTARLRTWLIGPPSIVFLVSCPNTGASIPECEQVFAAGAVATTLLHAVAARGFGTIWLTGWPAYAPQAHEILGVKPGETVVGLFPIGKPMKRPAERPRPRVEDLLTEWPG
ncbi:MAG: nitroreductase [Kiloniellales bacterium]|nr:nitroreductase [Kiloniellales bacterium]